MTIPNVTHCEAVNMLNWCSRDVDHAEQRIGTLELMANRRPERREYCLTLAKELRDVVLPRLQQRLTVACVTYGPPNYR